MALISFPGNSFQISDYMNLILANEYVFAVIVAHSDIACSRGEFSTNSHLSIRIFFAIIYFKIFRIILMKIPLELLFMACWSMLLILLLLLFPGVSEKHIIHCLITSTKIWLLIFFFKKTLRTTKKVKQRERSRHTHKKQRTETRQKLSHIFAS